MVPSDNFVVRFLALDLLQELDAGALDNLDNLRPEFREQPFDPGNRFSVPWATGTTGIGYDSAEFPEPPGWEMFADERYAGRVTLLNEIRDAFAVAHFLNDANPNSTSPGDIAQAADLLIEMKTVIRGFDSADYLDDLASGELVAAHAYSSDVLLARRENPSLEFSLPDQGALRWVDSLAVPTDAAHKGNAERFIDYFLRPEVSARVARGIEADTGNATALERLPESFVSNQIISPPEDTLARLVFTEDLGEAEELYREAWERVQEA